jgi:hypothetical protein
MPPWSTAEGGPLNEFQIQQLVILITSERFSEGGWEWAVEQGNHNDAFIRQRTRGGSRRERRAIVLDAPRLAGGRYLRIGGAIDGVRSPAGRLLDVATGGGSASRFRRDGYDAGA